METVAADHDSIERASKSPHDVPICAVDCETSDGLRIELHAVFCSYMADIPETGDLLLLIREAHISAPRRR